MPLSEMCFADEAQMWNKDDIAHELDELERLLNAQPVVVAASPG